MIDAAKPLSFHVRQAVAECDRLAEDERYWLESASWHSVMSSGRCAVCLAGAMMARRADPAFNLGPDSERWAYDEAMLFHALDDIREGLILDALMTFDEGGGPLEAEKLAPINWRGAGEWRSARWRLLARADYLERLGQ